MHFYIKSGFGVRTTGGGYASAQTGTFAALGASNVYAKLTDAIADGMVAGDYWYTSNLHDFDNIGSAIVYGFAGGGFSYGLSVDDVNIDQYKKGAKEQTNSSIKFNGKSTIKGVDFKTNNAVYLGTPNSAVKQSDNTITLNSSGDYIGAITDGCFFELINSTVLCNTASQGVRCYGGSIVKLLNVIFSSAVNLTSLLQTSSGSGGGRIDAVDCDLTPFVTYLLGNHGSSQTADDRFELIIDKCKLASGVSFIQETITNPDTYILVTNSASSSALAEHQFYFEDYFGKVHDQTSAGVHRNETTAFTDGEKVSFKVTSKSTAKTMCPFVFDFPASFVALSQVTTDTIRIFFAVVNTTTLNEQDIWGEAIYPDGTNKHVFNFATNANADTLSAGTTHVADSSSVWKNGASDLTGYNEYYMDIPTSSDPGHDSVPIIRINIGISSEIIYICTTFDVV